MEKTVQPKGKGWFAGPFFLKRCYKTDVEIE